MKQKLFFIAMLILSSFAFVSCDEVIDNPAISSEASLQQWNYEVSVKFADFDFTGVPGGPYAYKAPQKIQVYNEAGTWLGELTTADEIDDLTKFYKFAGTLEGTFGENLIIATLKEADYEKQDGSLKSIIDNNVILQTSKVAVRNYSTAASVVYTANATLENKVAIAHMDFTCFGGSFPSNGDKISIKSDAITTADNIVTLTISDDKTTVFPNDLYFAIPAAKYDEFDYSITSSKQNGEIVGCTLDDLQLDFGKVNDNTGIPLSPTFETTGVDLTEYDAYMRENDATYLSNIESKTANWYSINVADEKEFIVTQKGDKALELLALDINGAPNTKIQVTLDNIRLNDCSIYARPNPTVTFNLIGENSFGQIWMLTPCKKTGSGTWKFDRLMLDNWNGYTVDAEGVATPNSTAGEFTINENMDLKFLQASTASKLTIADGVTVNVISEDYNAVSIHEYATINVGNGAKATLNAECTKKDATVINIDDHAILNLNANSVLTVQGGKENTALNITNNSKFNLGKSAKATLVGGPEGIIGIGTRMNNSTIELLDEGANLTSTGIDRQGLLIEGNDVTSTIKIAKGATVTVKDDISGEGVSIQEGQSTKLVVEGKGKFIASSSEGYAAHIGHGYTWSATSGEGSITLKGGCIAEFTGSTDKPAIRLASQGAWTLSGKLIIDEDVENVTATSKMTTSPICIFDELNNQEAEIDILVADKTKFNDTTSSGVRTITPKPVAAP